MAESTDILAGAFLLRSVRDSIQEQRSHGVWEIALTDVIRDLDEECEANDLTYDRVEAIRYVRRLTR